MPASPPASLRAAGPASSSGISTSDYALHLSSAAIGRRPTRITASGTAHSMASGRLSYVLGLQGPSVAVDTACSSSLVAVHLAVQSPAHRRVPTMALAGGVNLMLMPDGPSRSRALA